MLSALLNQNPKFYSSPISALGPLIYSMIQTGTHETYTRNIENVYRTESLFRSIFDVYYSEIDRPIIFDRAKQWGYDWSMAFFKEYLTKKLGYVPTEDQLESYKEDYMKNLEDEMKAY